MLPQLTAGVSEGGSGGLGAPDVLGLLLGTPTEAMRATKDRSVTAPAWLPAGDELPELSALAMGVLLQLAACAACWPSLLLGCCCRSRLSAPLLLLLRLRLLLRRVVLPVTLLDDSSPSVSQGWICDNAE